MKVNSELRLGINKNFIVKSISRLHSRGALGTQTGTVTWSQPPWDSLLSGEGRRGIKDHQTLEQNSVSGEHRAIATESRGLKHLIRFLSEVKRTQFKTNATLQLVEQRGSSSMNNSLLRDGQALFLLYFVDALEPIL